MRAAVVSEPGGPEVLHVEHRPMPPVPTGWVLVEVRAFGLNRSELVTRAGGSGDAVRFPRVLGIECVGEVADPGTTDLLPGQTVIAAMGGMGREFDGGYAEFCLLPRSHVIPVRSNLAWRDLGAIPESFGTAWGSLDLLRLTAGSLLLVRGATSSVGMAAITIAKNRGLRVIATTRQERKRAALRDNGADVVLIDDGTIAPQVRELVPDGADALLELIGPRVIPDSLAALKSGASGCLTGYLGQGWQEVDRARSEALRLGITLETFGSNVMNASTYGTIFQSIVDEIEHGRYRVNVDRVFTLADIARAHAYMEANHAAGKVVGTP